MQFTPGRSPAPTVRSANWSATQLHTQHVRYMYMSHVHVHMQFHSTPATHRSQARLWPMSRLRLMLEKCHNRTSADLVLPPALLLPRALVGWLLAVWGVKFAMLPGEWCFVRSPWTVLSSFRFIDELTMLGAHV